MDYKFRRGADHPKYLDKAIIFRRIVEYIVEHGYPPRNLDIAGSTTFNIKISELVRDGWIAEDTGPRKSFRKWRIAAPWRVPPSMREAIKPWIVPSPHYEQRMKLDLSKLSGWHDE